MSLDEEMKDFFCEKTEPKPKMLAKAMKRDKELILVKTFNYDYKYWIVFRDYEEGTKIEEIDKSRHNPLHNLLLLKNHGEDEGINSLFRAKQKFKKLVKRYGMEVCDLFTEAL